MIEYQFFAHRVRFARNESIPSGFLEITFSILGRRRKPELAKVRIAWRSAGGRESWRQPRKPCQTNLRMSVRPRNHFATPRIAFGRSSGAGSSRYLAFAILGDFELSAAPWPLSKASRPPEEVPETTEDRTSFFSAQPPESSGTTGRSGETTETTGTSGLAIPAALSGPSRPGVPRGAAFRRQGRRQEPRKPRQTI